MKTSIANLDSLPRGAARPDARIVCSRCGQDSLEPRLIQTAIWQNGNLLVIRNIPSLVCPTCGEEFVDRKTTRGLDRMRDHGFAKARAAARMIVPVIDYVAPDAPVTE